MGFFDRFKKSRGQNANQPGSQDETVIATGTRIPTPDEATTLSRPAPGLQESEESTAVFTPQEESTAVFTPQEEPTAVIQSTSSQSASSQPGGFQSQAEESTAVFETTPSNRQESHDPYNSYGSSSYGSSSRELPYANLPAAPKRSLLTRIFNFFKSKPSYGIPIGRGAGAGGTGGGGSNNFLTEGRPPFEPAYAYLVLLLIALMSADLTLVANRDKLLPDEAPQIPQRATQFTPLPNRSEYDRIAQRNPFNADGMIPDPLHNQNKGPEKLDGPPVPTTLTQLTLVGTLVHINPKRSVATIQIKGAPEKILPFFVGDDIVGLAELTKVERKKAIFRNRQSGRLEYIEIKDNSPLLFGRSRPAAEGTDIKQEGNNFSLSRTELNDKLKNINQILQQATAVPNVLPGGQIDGFRLIDIQPGSIYEKLGLKKNDVIKGVNGTQVDSANRAIELYNQLKNSSQIAIDVDRNGSRETMTYSVTQ